MGSNREKSNIAIAILEKLPILKGKKNIDQIKKNKESFIYILLYL